MLKDVFEELKKEEPKYSTFSNKEIRNLKEELAEISINGDKLCIFVKPGELSLRKFEGRNISAIDAKRITKSSNIEATWSEYNQHIGKMVEHRLVMSNVTLNRSFDNETILGNDCAIWSSLDFSKERERMLEERKMERDEFELER